MCLDGEWASDRLQRQDWAGCSSVDFLRPRVVISSSPNLDLLLSFNNWAELLLNLWRRPCFTWKPFLHAHLCAEATLRVGWSPAAASVYDCWAAVFFGLAAADTLVLLSAEVWSVDASNYIWKPEPINRFPFVRMTEWITSASAWISLALLIRLRHRLARSAISGRSDWTSVTFWDVINSFGELELPEHVESATSATVKCSKEDPWSCCCAGKLEKLFTVVFVSEVSEFKMSKESENKEMFGQVNRKYNSWQYHSFFFLFLH